MNLIISNAAKSLSASVSDFGKETATAEVAAFRETKHKVSARSVSYQSGLNGMAAKQTTAVPSRSRKTDQRGHIMQFSIKSDCVTALRHLIISKCGDQLIFMRIQPIEHATMMNVSLLVGEPAMGIVMETVKNLDGMIQMKCLSGHVTYAEV